MSAISINDSGTLVDRDAIEIGELYERGRKSLVDSARYSMECGAKLAAKKAELPHGEWLPWLADNAGVLGFEGPRTAQRLIKLVGSNASLTSHLDEPAAADLSRKLWGNSTNHRAIGTGENEWYTPAEYVQKARDVMGDIDLDPASCPEANDTVKAPTYFTAEDDGLAQTWAGRIWLNPPYSRDLMPAFVEKLKASYLAGEVTAAILVSHNNTDTAWFHSLTEVAAAICFTKNRIKFYRDEASASPTQGQAFFYLGDDPERFANEFGGIGMILQRMDRRAAA